MGSEAALSATDIFSGFEILGYVVPGAVIISGLLLNYGPLDSLGKIGSYQTSIGPAAILFYAGLLISAYALGQISSALSGYLIEKMIVVRLWGNPNDNLFAPVAKRTHLFQAYAAPYSKEFVEEFTAVFQARYGSRFGSRDRFLICLHDIKEKMPIAYTRLDRFIRHYEFARNLAMALWLLGVALLFKAATDLSWVSLGIALFAIAGAFALLPRYLAFFRRYRDEVFRSFFVLHKNTQ